MKKIKLVVSLVLLTGYAQAQKTNKLDSTGNVGIGTLIPAQKLEVADSGTAAVIQLSQKQDILGNVGVLKFNLSATEVARIEAERTVATNRLSALKFYVRTDSGTVESMRLSHTGFLGLGTTSPTAKFQVNTLQGTIFAKFTQSNIGAADGFLQLRNATTIDGSLIPSIHAKSYTVSRPFGLFINAEADDIVPVGADTTAGAIVLDGRTKSNSRLNTNNILMVNTYGNNLLAVKADGSVGIGTVNTHGYKLAVNGTVIATQLTVKNYGTWPDYVFEQDYQLPSLNEVESYVKEHKHLPDMPAAKDVEEGVNLGEMNKQLLKKVEELTLYIIEQGKMIKELQEKVK